MTSDFFVMVAINEMFGSIEAPSNPFEIIVGKEGKVTEVIDCVVMFDDCIPICNQSFVHILHGIERTIAVLNNVFMTPMGVRSKVNHIIFLLVGPDRIELSTKGLKVPYSTTELQTQILLSV